MHHARCNAKGKTAPVQNAAVMKEEKRLKVFVRSTLPSPRPIFFVWIEREALNMTIQRYSTYRAVQMHLNRQGLRPILIFKNNPSEAKEPSAGEVTSDDTGEAQSTAVLLSLDGHGKGNT